MPLLYAHRQYDEYISNVDIRSEHVDGKTNHMRVIYKFRPFVFEGVDNIEIKGATILPQKVIDQIVTECLPAHEYRVDIGVMDKVRERIEKWCVLDVLLHLCLSKWLLCMRSCCHYQGKGLPFSCQHCLCYQLLPACELSKKSKHAEARP